MEDVVTTFDGGVEASRHQKIGFEELEIGKERSQMARLGRIRDAANGASHSKALREQVSDDVGCNVSRRSRD